jgi:3-methylfumaryl-CoA hydratase
MQDAKTHMTCQRDVCDVARAQALVSTLGLANEIVGGKAMPPFFHQIYFWDPHPAEALGRDGHPKVGGLIPDMGLPRRMWAGGRLIFHAPLLAGVAAEKRSCCEASQRKTGRSGPLALVTLRHEYHQQGKLCVTEWQDLVYREDPSPDAPKPVPPQAPDDAETEDRIGFSTTLLFRYSALTFNGHRIHYDQTYARDVEGYDGLVVHGPLLAQMLILKAEAELGPLGGFSFRATAPLMHTEPATLCRKGRHLWVRGPDGRQCMVAEAETRSE